MGMDPITQAAIITGISAAASGIYGAKKSSDANKKSTEMQVDASVKAAELSAKATQDALLQSKQQWEYGIGAALPYTTIGKQSMGTLGQLMGISPKVDTNEYGAPLDIEALYPTPKPPTGPTEPAGPTTLTPEQMAANRVARTVPQRGATAGTDLSSVAPSPDDSPAAPTPKPLQAVAQQPQAGQMVWLQAPNGQRKQVSAADAPKYIAMGAIPVTNTRLNSFASQGQV